jgi:hypothetical protein
MILRLKRQALLRAGLAAAIGAALFCAGGPTFAAEDPFSPGMSLLAADGATSGEEAAEAETAGLTLQKLDLRGAIPSSIGLNIFRDGVFVFNMLLPDASGNYAPSRTGTLAFDADGRVLFFLAGEEAYSYVRSYSEGFAAAGRYLPMPERKPGELTGPPGVIETYIDKNGRALFAPGSYGNLQDFHEGLAAVEAEADGIPAEHTLYGYGYGVGYVNTDGALVIPPRYKRALFFREDLAPVQDPLTDKWGFIDKSGALTIPCAYDAALPFSEGLAYVESDGKAGYIDKAGAVAIPLAFPAETNKTDPAYVNGDYSFYKGLAAARSGETVVLYDGAGNARPYALLGYIDKTGAFAIEPAFMYAEPFVKDLAWATYANEAFTVQPSALIDREGQRQTPFWTYGRYEGTPFVHDDADGLYPVGESFAAGAGRWGALNGNGAEAIPLRFDYLYPGGDAALGFSHDDNEGRFTLIHVSREAMEKRGGKLIRVEIDGAPLHLPDADPVIESGRVLAPLRAVFEALGAEVAWDPASRAIFGVKDGTDVRLKIDETEALVNGRRVVLDAAPQLIAGRTMVPIRFIAECFSAEADWNAETRTVSIRTRAEEAALTP